MAKRLEGWGDVLLVLGLFLAALAMRVPLRSRILYHWDSVNYAFAMRHFDMLRELPHPPGYIVYVWMCRLVAPLFDDANTTMVWISVVSSALGVVALFFLGRSMFNRQVGLVGALFLLVSPLAWFYGELALPHALDLLLATTAAWGLYRIMRGDERLLFPVTILLALAGGVRPQTPVFFFPLIVFAVRRVKPRKLALAAGVGGVMVLSWLVPLLASCGGVSNYWHKVASFSHRFSQHTSVLSGAGWAGFQYNVSRLGLYTLYAANLVVLPVTAVLAARLLRKAPLPGDRERLVFLALWVAPAMAFYAFIHMGQYGLVLVFLPALLVFGAAALVHLLGPRPRWLAGVVGVTLLPNLVLFCLVPEYPQGKDGTRLLTYQSVVNSDRYFADRLAAIRRHFSPEATAILAANSIHADYYLPQYLVLPFEGAHDRFASPPGPETMRTAGQLGLRPDPQGQVAVVIFDEKLSPFNASASSRKTLALEHGGVLEYLTLPRDSALRIGPQSFAVEDISAR
jgi:4-amino-4-deoxy-L-arabinose transferase-like glycosyltransferase